ncbi:MAG: sialate O-acetylesterase [Lachnospiraceae bacterium]|nr:sialate O-acetylesterase [Lachnospiraceae bacterium]
MRKYDLIMFMGQSNMAGRGIVSERWPQSAVECKGDAGYEFRAISDPTKLYYIEEPFGVNENNPNGINEPGMKTGSLVSAFVNSYYETSGVPVIAVSASKGGSKIESWQGNDDYLTDAIERLERAEKYCRDKDIDIRHRFMVWCQGESDGDAGTSAEAYNELFLNMLDKMLEAGIEKCFLIIIGEYNGAGDVDYSIIRNAQFHLAGENSNVILVSNDFCKMKERGLMKDAFHYYQQAYNEVGDIAGKQAGIYTK